MMTEKRVLGACWILAATLIACGGDDESAGTSSAKACDAKAQTGCAVGTVCEEVQGGEPACFAPLSIQGRVFDLSGDTGIAGARVVARDANDAAVSDVAITATDGHYELVVPAPRDANGQPVKTQYTIRADATGYDTFPKAPRTAVPIDVSDAAGSPMVVQNAATDIGLIALAEANGLGWVAGTIEGLNEDRALIGGALVVAGGVTGLADRSGDFVIYNVPAGSGVQVSGYAAGLSIESKNIDVVAGKETAGVKLALVGKTTSTVRGKVSIVNPGDGTDTSIILAVEETFLEATARGESPRGLRAPDVSGDWSIEGVPDGKYVVLAAFENDDLVRDPDTSIAGTDIVHITVAGKDVTLDESFKITGALAVLEPGATELDEVSGTPTFAWEDDSSEDGYRLELHDAFGNMIWKDDAVPSVSGGGRVERKYEGPALEAGMIYQFKATSMKNGTPISSTEDLKGAFVYAK